jgi:hypothetical protein
LQVLGLGQLKLRELQIGIKKAAAPDETAAFKRASLIKVLS